MEKTAHCPLDCPDACSLIVRVRNDRVVAVDGSDRNPLTGGFICAKVRAMPRHLYGSDRLLYPALRSGSKGSGQFRRVSWGEALDRVAQRMRQVASRYGGESILPFSYGGSNGLLTQDTSDARLFRRLGASRLKRTVCAAPTTAAARGLYGKIPGVAFHDYVHARLIVIWGCNPAVTGIHLLPYIEQARRDGARLVVVDPRRTRLARRADLHLALRPGSDLVVALAIAHWLFGHDRADQQFLARHATGVREFRRRAARWPLERAAAVAGVAPEQIEQLATWYADTEPAVIRSGWGMERNRNGCAAVAAVLALPAVAGKFGLRGGGYTLSNSGAFRLEAAAAANEPPTQARVVNMNQLGRALLQHDPPVRVLFSYNCNPVAVLPDQRRVIEGLEREDLFTVVFEQTMTDTARYADVLLPATTFLEHDELSSGYGAMLLQRSEAAVPAAGEARPNYEVFTDLCQRLGLQRPDDPQSTREMAAAILGASAHEQLQEKGVLFPETGAAPIAFVDLMPRTSNAKVNLVPDDLDAEAPGGLYDYQPDPATQQYPLALISPATKRTVSSTLGQLRQSQVAVRIHPEDAKLRAISDGDSVRMFNDLGEVHCLVWVTDRMRPGVVFLPKGLWSHNTLNGLTSNALVPDSLTDVGGGACFNDARVQIEALAGEQEGSRASHRHSSLVRSQSGHRSREPC